MPRHEQSRRADSRRRVHHRQIEPYSLALSEDAVESLSRGECPEDVALSCWEMLRWKRDAARRRVRELNGEE
jgi:hypothetical protein